jgi:lysophospholipase L1-like esterase
MNPSTNDQHNLTTQDVIVLNAGANDLYKNNKGLALARIVNLIQNDYNTNIIIMDIPHRYDLSFSSYMNCEIQKFNRKLKEIVNLYNHASLLETILKREFFTRHGLHLTQRGKEVVANR